MKIGIIGHGFVGKAVTAGFCIEANELEISDPYLKTTTADVLKINPEVIFICVPTPMGPDGVIDASIVEGVSKELEDYTGLVVLKSTVIPSEVDRISNMFQNFVYNPEFLTEANAVEDFLSPTHHVFGGKREHCIFLEKVYKNHSCCAEPTRGVFYTTPVEASFIKYGINSFLFLKVLFANQFKSLIELHGGDYSVVQAAMQLGDPRIGTTHMNVPGHDGRYGSASACFSKDVPALVKFSESEMSILKEAWNVNCDIRNSYDTLLPREIEQNISFNKI